MAGVGGLCKPGGVLCVWDSSGCNIGVLVTDEGKRALDWNTSWCICTEPTTLHYNNWSKLGKTGLL